MIFGERAGNFRQRGGNLIRLGRQNQNVRGPGDFEIGGGGFRAGFGGEMFARGVKRVGGDDFARKNDFRLDKTFGERGGHFARAEKTDFGFGCHALFVAGGGVRRKRNCAGNPRLNSAG